VTDSDAAARYGPRIRAIAPKVQIESLAVNLEGLANEVVVVNGEWAFRFAREGEWARRALRAEIAVLDRLRSRLPLSVPEPFYASKDALAYRRLPGETLSRDLVYSLEADTRGTIAAQLGEFLRGLHGVPLDGLPDSSAPVRYDDWAKIRAEVEEKLYPLMLRHQREWAARLFGSMLADAANFDYPPRLIHGDLGPYHIMFDRAAGRLSGVIDFGVAGAGDPANDLGILLQVYGERFVSSALEAYPEARAWLPRARFYAQAVEFQWALSGLKTGDPQWFVAHLGGARDLL
jgi:aminoglycoside 2''-phosphotransferase